MSARSWTCAHPVTCHATPVAVRRAASDAQVTSGHDLRRCVLAPRTIGGATIKGESVSERLKAVVLLSGGLDSTTTLAIAQAEGFAVHALSFSYGQRHRVELDAARRVVEHFGVVAHKI